MAGRKATLKARIMWAIMRATFALASVGQAKS
jgi:hypothetical protein